MSGTTNDKTKNNTDNDTKNRTNRASGLAALITGLIAAVGISAISINPPDAEELYVNESGQVCFSDITTKPFTTPGPETFMDARDTAAEKYDQFLQSVFGQEVADQIGGAGLLLTKFSPEPADTKKGTYRAICEVCANIDWFSPDAQDKMYDKIGLKERGLRWLNTKIYGSSVYFAQVGSQTYTGGATESEQNAVETRIRTYVASTRSRPYAEALDKIMDDAGFDSEKRNNIWKSLSDENGMIMKDKAKKLYSTWMKIIQENKLNN